MIGRVSSFHPRNISLSSELRNQALPVYNSYIPPSVWRPLRGPVRDWPLAVADSSTVDTSKVQAADVVFGDFTTEHHLVQYDENLKWYFLSNQEPNEAWAFLQADSQPEGLIGTSNIIDITRFVEPANISSRYTAYFIRSSRDEQRRHSP